MKLRAALAALCAFHVAVRLAFLDDPPPVSPGPAARQRQLHLGMMSLDVEPERDHREALPFGGEPQALYLPSVQQ